MGWVRCVESRRVVSLADAMQIFAIDAWEKQRRVAAARSFVLFCADCGAF